MKRSRLSAAGRLWARCYLAGALALAAWMLANALLDTFCYATGRLHTQYVTLDDTSLYTLVNLARTDADTLTAVTGDAQLLLTPGQRIRTLRLTAQYSAAGSEMDLYWHLPGRGYSASMRVWPVRTADGGAWCYTLPQLTGQNIRLDLADQAGVAVTVQTIVLNEQPPFWRYFVPSLWQLLWLGILPGLAAAALTLARGVRAQARRAGRKHWPA